MLNPPGGPSGVQTNAQNNVPSAVNNGNPNTTYNWTSYNPQVLPPLSLGGQPQLKFNLQHSAAPASSPGYVPPFTADPYAAVMLAGMPRATQNNNVNNLLANMMRRPVFNVTPQPPAATTTTPDPQGNPAILPWTGIPDRGIYDPIAPPPPSFGGGHVGMPPAPYPFGGGLGDLRVTNYADLLRRLNDLGWNGSP